MKPRFWTTALLVAALFASPSRPAAAQSGTPVERSAEGGRRSPGAAPTPQSDPKTPASAPARPSAPAEEADALIRQGLELRRKGDDAGALALFERAHALAPTPKALAQRALAEQALGSWVVAEQHLLEALAPDTDPWIATNRPSLQAALSTIQEHLASVSLHGGVAGAEVRVNGQSVGKLPLAAPIRVVAGTVVLDVTHAGYYALQRQFVVNPGDRAAETIAMTATPAAAPGAPVTAQPLQPAPAVGADSGPPAAGGGLPPVVFWVGVGTTVALAGVTVWSGLDTASKNDDYEAYTAEENAEFEQGKDLYDDAKGRQDRTNILIGVTAAVGVGTAIVALLTDWGGSETRAGKNQGARRPMASVQLSPYGAGLACAGSF